ncbi:MAG: hypothetical protein NVSMB63_02060 [Sediminibacterium sp.]
MEHEIIISNAAEIKNIAGEISLFHTQKRVIKVQFPHFSKEENIQLEKKIATYYMARESYHGGLIGIFTVIGYMILVSTKVISIQKLGIVNTILLYFACSFITMTIGKLYHFWQARRQLNRLAEELQSMPSFSYS